LVTGRDDNGNGTKSKFLPHILPFFKEMKTVNFRKKHTVTSHRMTKSVTKIITENGRKGYGTVLRINTALKIFSDLGKVYFKDF
jgi:hypothetical protein